MSWKLTSGRSRCQKCGELVDSSWKFFEKPLLYTQCLCEECVGKLTASDESAILSK